MQGRKDLTEKRRYRRFRLRQPAFVLLDTDPVRLREILDLGMNGLAITSIADGAGSPKEAHRLAIISRIDRHEPEEYLEVVCRIVQEKELREFPPSRFTRKRVGIELIDLTPRQRRKLARFILDNAEDQG